MSKVAILGDTHFGMHADDERYLTNAETFFSRVFFPYLEKHGIDTIIHLGDIVDRRTMISYRTLDRIQQIYLTKAREFEGYYIAGNHDCSFRNSNRVNSLETLFSQFAQGGKHQHFYWQNPEEAIIHGKKFLFMPWISPENEAASMAAIRDTDAKVAIAHLPLIGFMQNQYANSMSLYGFDPRLFKKFEIVFTGHFHSRSLQGNILYTGMPYEQSWVDSGEFKGFHVYDTSTGKYEFVTNPHRMHVIVRAEQDLAVLDANIGPEALIRVVADPESDRAAIDSLSKAVEARGNDWNLQIVEDVKPDVSNMVIRDMSDTSAIIRIAVDQLGINETRKKALLQLLNELHDHHTSAGVA